MAYRYLALDVTRVSEAECHVLWDHAVSTADPRSCTDWRRLITEQRLYLSIVEQGETDVKVLAKRLEDTEHTFVGLSDGVPGHGPGS